MNDPDFEGMEGALVALLLASDLVRGKVGKRVHSPALPQGAQLPALVIRVISGDDDYTHKGPDELAERRVQIDAWAKTKAEARSAARAVRKLLSGFRGAVDVAGQVVELGPIFAAGDRDLFEGEAPDRRIGRSQDFTVWAREPDPT